MREKTTQIREEGFLGRRMKGPGSTDCKKQQQGHEAGRGLVRGEGKETRGDGGWDHGKDFVLYEVVRH